MTTEIIQSEGPVEREFYVFANALGVAEIRISDDVQYAMSVYAGIGGFICQHLRSNADGGKVALPQFLRDLAVSVEQAEALKQAAANDDASNPAPEVA